MKSKNEFTEIDLKIVLVIILMINGTDINFSYVLLDKKLHENISVYDILYKTSTGPKLLRIKFDNIDGFILFLMSKLSI